MRPFEFIILFFSFIYTLALTHQLFAVTRMIRHRRNLVFSWAHALWMATAFLLLVTNWIELWDFHQMDAMPLAALATGMAMVGVQYFFCALVSPDFEDGESYDMRAFHAREGRTYMVAGLALLLLSFAINAAAGASEGVQNWANQNAPLLVCLPFGLLPLFVRASWAQILSPLVLIADIVFVLVNYYPVLR